MAQIPPMPQAKTLVWKQTDKLPLHADVYIPSNLKPGEKRPIAILFHGGGHVMFSRKRVNPKQVALLIGHGFLPVSFDYRLCPELNVLDGPMNDVCEALRWARFELPSLAPTLAPGLEANGGMVVAVGWSAGGHLSMTLGFTAPRRGIRAPEAILAFYCPTDYSAEWWRIPNHPKFFLGSPDEPYDVLEGLQKEPIAEYIPTGRPGMLSLADPRSRLILHTTWKGHAVPFLIRGPTYDPTGSTFPTKAEIDSISPYAHILNGAFHTPTFLIHGKLDDLVDHHQSIRTVQALKEKGVEANIEIVEGAAHLFDAFPQPGVDFEPTVTKAYTWLAKQVSDSSYPVRTGRDIFAMLRLRRAVGWIRSTIREYIC